MEKPFIAVVHFNNKTFEENDVWRKDNSYEGCIYGLDKRTENIPHGEKIIIIEMNNDNDEITGIGYITNIFKSENRSRIYSDENYNRIVYKGKKRIDRKKLLIGNKDMIKYLERILFKGSRHFKRGNGVLKIPHNRLACTYKERERKPTQCGNCGELGHNKRSCKNEERVKRKHTTSEKKNCKYCGEKLKGHVCKANKIDENKKNEIIKFLNGLF
tara:strand:+ start:2466 stop:3110 length:645 start_codon:yes stop_codon:yes gene_type:complete